MVVGEGLDEHNTSSVQVEGGTVDVVNHFTYLGSNISRDGKVTVEIDCRIARDWPVHWDTLRPTDMLLM